MPVKSILSEISKAKDKMLTPEEMRKEAEFDSRKAQIAKVYEIYQTKLKTADAMDFDDMLCNTVKLLKQHPIYLIITEISSSTSWSMSIRILTRCSISL